MATVFDDFIRLPPDGGGKRTHADFILTLNYNTAGGNTFAVGDRVTGVSSGFIGDVLFSQVITSDLGAIALRPIFGSTVFATIATEDLNVLGSPIAKADDAGIAIYKQNIHLSGANNPSNKQFVDNKGAAYIRFDEGPQQLDAFGLSRQTSPTQLAEYTFHYGDTVSEIFTDVAGGGTSTHLPDQSAMRLGVGTADGDRVTRTTNRYHFYQAGFGQLSEMTVVCGDTGKTNLTRRWGYFDDDNGVFFELDDTTLYVVTRSNATGSVVDTRVPQSSWNVDRLDGSGVFNLSKHTIDITKLHLYWMDVQWLGGGTARWGVYENGERITVHREYHGETAEPFTATATLPLRWEIFNSGGTTAGPSTMNVVCSVVKTDGNLNPDFQKNLNKSSYITPAMALDNGDTTGEFYIASFRSTSLIGSKTNRKISIPEIFQYFVNGEPCIFRVYKNCILNNTNFNKVGDSVVEADIAGGISEFGELLFPIFAGSGVGNLNAPANFGYLGQHLRRRADGAPGEVYTITAEPQVIATAPTEVTFGMTWVDMG